MNSAALSAVRREDRISLRLEMACNLGAVRAAALAVRDWLAAKSLPTRELDGWELALTEAATNAVKYAVADARQLPVTIEVFWGEREVEARITDHTGGFDWPNKMALPDVDEESGRGLFLIQSLSDKVVYLRHPGQNIMILHRARSTVEALPDVTQLQNRLADAEAALMDITAELSSSYESLVALFRYSAELGANTNLKEFANRLLKDLMQLTEADCTVLRLLSPDGKKLETLLVLPENGKTFLPAVGLTETVGSVEIKTALNRQDFWFGLEKPLAGEDPLRVVMPAGNGICHGIFVANQLVGTAALGRLTTGKAFTAAQVNLLHTFTDFLAIQIVNARLMNERTSALVTQRELQIAADIQRSLLPAKIPTCRPFGVSAVCQNALQVGGDFYDIIPTGDGGLLMVIADVMGKGMPAALFAAVLRSTIRSMPQLFDRPGELLAAANRTLFPDLSRVDMFATAQIAFLDTHRHKIVFASAGHCPLLICQPGAAATVARNESGYPLGIEPLTQYLQSEIPLLPGAVALLYTDGVSELRNVAGEMLGDKKLMQMLTQSANQTSDLHTVKHLLLGCLADYGGPVPLVDDQTLILIKHLI